MFRIYGSPQCPDCRECKANFDANKVAYKYVDINESMANLKAFLKLRDTLPVRTSYGRYRTMDGEIGIFKKSSPYYDLLQKYYYLEYNGLRAGDDYLREAFLPSRNTGS